MFFYVFLTASCLFFWCVRIFWIGWVSSSNFNLCQLSCSCHIGLAFGCLFSCDCDNVNALILLSYILSGHAEFHQRARTHALQNARSHSRHSNWFIFILFIRRVSTFFYRLYFPIQTFNVGCFSGYDDEVTEFPEPNKQVEKLNENKKFWSVFVCLNSITNAKHFNYLLLENYFHLLFWYCGIFFLVWNTKSTM